MEKKYFRTDFKIVMVCFKKGLKINSLLIRIFSILSEMRRFVKGLIFC